MINLLPFGLNKGYRYARSNVILRRWVVIQLIALIGLAAIATYGLLTLEQSSREYSNKISSRQDMLRVEQYDKTQAHIKNINGNFKLVIKVLEQEILFSELIKQIGTTIPSRANLTGLNISQTKGAIDISANAADYKTATQVQVNLSDPQNKIFSRADIVNINCGGGGSSASGSATKAVNSKYPCTVNIRALFAPDNPYLFINSKGKKP
jgi:hypothetical protein